MMDTTVLLIGIIGLCCSLWVLRGYFSPTQGQSAEGSAKGEEGGQRDRVPEPVPEAAFLQAPQPRYETEGHQRSIQEVAQPVESGTVALSEGAGSARQIGIDAAPTTLIHSETTPDPEGTMSPKWQEIFSLQAAYRAEREREVDIDYEREQALFDLAQGVEGDRLDGWEVDRLEHQLKANRLEEGEPVSDYQERLNTFASLTKEMLIMRLDAADTRLREKQENHQATLLSIISSLIERIPGDTNLKSIAQASLATVTPELSNLDGGQNRPDFQAMFFKSFGS